MRDVRRNELLCIFGCLLTLVFGQSAFAEYELKQQVHHFDIPPQRADDALTMFAQQADISVLYQYDEAKQYYANRLQGKYTVSDAAVILLEKTGLTAAFDEQGHLIISTAYDEGEEKMNRHKNQKNKKRSFLASVATTLLAVFAANPTSAVAQETDARSSMLEEITVTAQKREQSLQDVGIAITAFSSEDIRQYGFSNAIDIISKVPGLDNYSNYGPGSSANIVVRGVGLNDFGEGHEAPVTAYVDEAYIVSVPAVDFALFDIDRVEVLRGPQGTLFGRNSTGGLVHFVTARPTKETTGFLSIGGGRFGEIKGEGAISGSLSDNLTGRLSFLAHHSDGYIDNVNPNLDDGGQAGTNAVRGQLMFEPSDDLRILAKVEYADVSKIHTYYEQEPMSVDPATGLFSTDLSGTDGAGYNEINFGAGDPNVTNTNRPSKLEQDGLSFLLRIEKDFESFTLTSVTSYLEMDRALVEDCDASANDICFADFPYETDWITQELRANGSTDNMRWTAGVYYLHQNAKNNPDAVFNIPLGGPTAVDPTTGLYNGAIFPIALAANWEQDTDSYSFFGQVEYDITPAFTLIGGVRWGEDKKDFTDFDNATLRTPGNLFLVADGGPAVANPFTDSRKDSLLSWKLEVDYRPSDDVLLFASVSRGTKAGGFNNGFLSPAAVADPATSIPYDDESNTAYEIGIKSTWLDRRLRLNASAFHYDYSDYQVFNWEGIGGLVVNNDANASGFEVEIEAALTEQLQARVGFGYLDTKIKDITGRAPGFTADRDMANAPEVTANGALTYDFHVSGNVDARIIWDWNYTSERFTNNFNDPTSELESYFKHNASVIFNIGENWSLSAYVRNISDKENENKVFVFGDLNYRQVIHAQPRTYGANLTYSF